MMNGVRLGVFAAMSVDGYLADSEDGLDFLAQVERQVEDYGYMAFASRVKGYVVGRRTFDIVSALCGGQFPHEGKWPCFVLTRTHLQGNNRKHALRELLAEGLQVGDVLRSDARREVGDGIGGATGLGDHERRHHLHLGKRGGRDELARTERLPVVDSAFQDGLDKSKRSTGALAGRMRKRPRL